MVAVVLQGEGHEGDGGEEGKEGEEDIENQKNFFNMKDALKYFQQMRLFWFTHYLIMFSFC